MSKRRASTKRGRGNRKKLRRALAASLLGAGSALAAPLSLDVSSFTRNDPQQVFRRNTSELTPSSLDTEERRVESVLTTEDPALIYDWRSGRIVLEVLLMDNVEFEEQTPLIKDHRQYSIDSVVGSVIDHRTGDDQLLGWLCFLTDVDDDCEAVWQKVAQGALRRVSIGYDYDEADYETVPAGETRSVLGREFTAPEDRDLRVVTRWRLREVSLVVIPADPRAQMRAADRQGTSNPAAPESTLEKPTAPPSRSLNGETMKKFLQFLHQNGLAKSVTNLEQAIRWACEGNLTEAQLGELDKIAKSESVAFDRSKAKALSPDDPPGDPPNDPPPNPQRNNPGTGTATNPSPGTNDPPSDPIDPQRAAQDAVAAERQRVAAIREMHTQHPAVPDEVVARAENDGLTIEQTRTAFLEALRGVREPGIAPAGHVRGGDQVNLRVIQAALLERHGVTPDSPVLTTDLARTVGRRRELGADWLCNAPTTGQRRDDLEQAFDIANQRGLNNLSLMRAAELMIELRTGERLYDEQEIIERAFTTGGYTEVFGAVVHLVMMASYESTPTTYTQFCQVIDVGDFREHKAAEMGQVGRLKKQGKNPGQAATLNVDDPVLTSVLVERYAGQLKVTDQTLINDDFGVAGMLPTELGITCNDMADDLAMAQVLRTDNLSDGRQRYNATDGNIVTKAAFDESALTALGVALKAKKIGNRRIRVTNGHLLSGLTHSPTVRKQMNSQELNDELNPHRGTYTPIEDSAIDLGVDDPAQEDAAIAGTPNAVYAFAGTATKRSITVAFRRGTNRGPVTRSFQLQQGEWGVGWDVFMDMGAAFRRRIGTVRVDITG